MNATTLQAHYLRSPVRAKKLCLATRSCPPKNDQITNHQQDSFQAPAKFLVATCTSLWLSFAPACSATETASSVLIEPPAQGLVEDPYAKMMENRHNRSRGITTDSEANEYMMESYNQDMFTRDAWLGMQRLVAYGKYVDSLEERERMAGCEECSANREVLEEAWQVVANEYFDPYGRFTQAWWAGELQRALDGAGGTLKNKHELQKAAKQMVRGLGDNYSEFLDPNAFRAAIRHPTKAELEYMSTQAVGVGLKVGAVAKGTGRMITATLSGSAAEAAGVHMGDVLLSVDGIASSRATPEQVADQLRGPVGSPVDIVIAKSPMLYMRPTQELTLYRQPLQQVPAAHAIVQDPNNPSRTAQYIRINYFSNAATKQVMSAILEGEAMDVDGYIVDLRNNPGGVFEEAIAISSYFLDTDNSTQQEDVHIVETVRSMDATTRRSVIDTVWTVGMLPNEAFPRHAWGLTTRPMAVLTNQGSASASEVMAGALQDNERAVIIGETTFGKGVVQYFFRMADHSGVKLTVAKYLTPNYHDVALEGGIEADMVCHDNPKSVLPDEKLDSCITRALHYVATHPVMGTPGLTATR